MTSSSEARRVELGRFGKVYGIKGWLRLNSFTTPRENICSYGPLVTEIGGRWQELEIDQFRDQGNGLVVHVKGLDDPESARVMTGKGLWIERSKLPALAAGEYYWHDLVGLRVVNQHDAPFGVIAEMLETGANDVMVVAPNADSIDDRQRLIPYLLGSVVQQVDLAAGLVRVNWEADYLE